MKRAAFILLSYAVLSSAAYGNTFFNDFVGVWKETGKHTYVDDEGPHTWFSERTMRVTKLRRGVFYFYTTGKIEGKLSVSKSWLYPNGTYQGESSLDGEVGDKGNGRWRIDQRGRLVMSTTFKGQFGTVEGVIRKINKNKFVSTIKGGGTTSEGTLTRIRK